LLEESALRLWLSLVDLGSGILATELLQIEVLHELLDTVAYDEVNAETVGNFLFKLFVRERNQLKALVHLRGNLEDDGKDDRVHNDHAIP